MNIEPANIKVGFPADFPWQHVILEGEEEQRVLDDEKVQSPLALKTDKGEDSVSPEPAHD